MGHCISLIKPTAAPVQKLLTSKAFVDDTNLEQLSNFPRQNIPSHPVSKMAETDIHLKQESILPENNTKYSVDSSELRGKNPAKIDNVTAVVNTTHDQAHQKKPDKGTVITLFSNRFNLLQQLSSVVNCARKTGPAKSGGEKCALRASCILGMQCMQIVNRFNHKHLDKIHACDADKDN